MALKELREDKSRVILTVDKEVPMSVVDKQDYLNKAQDLLADKDTYTPISGDPITRHKKHIQTLRLFQVQDILSNNIYKRIYPTRAGTLKFYGLPQIPK